MYTISCYSLSFKIVYVMLIEIIIYLIHIHIHFLLKILYFRRFIETKLPELRILNQNTFFSIAEINDKFKTKSSCHFIYGDGKNMLYNSV
jgi:hypothetical protein